MIGVRTAPGIAMLVYGVLATAWHHLRKCDFSRTAAGKFGMASLPFIFACFAAALIVAAAGAYGLGLRSSPKETPTTTSHLKSIFEVEQVVPASLSNTDNEWIQITAKLRFKMAFQDGEIALFGHPNINLKTKPSSFLVYRLPKLNFLAGETLDVPIATVFIAENNRRPTNDFWGNGKTILNGLPKHEFVGASENVAEIELTNGGNVAQRFKSILCDICSRTRWTRKGIHLTGGS